ncbi:MAG: type II secretion system protein [Algisphaera sp.]
MKTRRSGFTLIELLVVLGIIGLLISLLMPALGKARNEARAVACASNLRQVGIGLASYIADHKDHFPYVDSALFENVGGLPVRNWDADPRDTVAHPHGWVAVMRYWVPQIDKLHCPDPVLGYPQADFAVTYRIASADNVTGVPIMPVDTPTTYGGRTTNYWYPFTYFNGRRSEALTVDRNPAHATIEGFPIVRGAGDHYLVRDFSNLKGGQTLLPHKSGINQLYVDLAVRLYRHDDAFPYVDDRPSD